MKNVVSEVHTIVYMPLTPSSLVVSLASALTIEGAFSCTNNQE